jgi:hypothetical protein
MIKENIPSSLHRLIPLVEKWGINDDGFRDNLVFNSSKNDLEDLVNSISNEEAETLDNWLSGTEAYNPPFTNEYLAYTCFLMAYDYAKAILKDM